MNDSRESNLTATPNVSFHKMEYKIVLSALLGLIIVVSLLANILVCLVILSSRTLRQSNDACFVLSVAVSDLLTTCLVIPFDLELIVSDSTEWRHGEIMCNVCTTAYLLTVPTSILSLLALSVYRYIKLKNPLDHLKLSPLITKRRVMAIIILLWIYSMLFALTPVFMITSKAIGEQTRVKNGFCHFTFSWIYSFVSNIINFLIPVLSSCLIHYKIYRIAIKSCVSFPKTVRLEQRQFGATKRGKFVVSIQMNILLILHRSVICPLSSRLAEFHSFKKLRHEKTGSNP